MKLTGKDKIDFVDSHLWAEPARFIISCQLRHIDKFIPILSDMKMIVQAHMDDSEDPEYFVSMEFNPVVMSQGRTERKLLQFIKIAYQYAGSVQITLDETSARIDGDCNVLEAWTNEVPL